MIDVLRADYHRDGGCCVCEHDANGNQPKRALFKFALGTWQSRLCVDHLDELRVAIERVIQEAYRR